MSSASRQVTTALFLVAFSSSTLDAQTSANGTISGLVTDQHGAAVPGVLVTAASLTVPGTHLATSDGAGQYRLGDLPPGDYTIVGELAGFARVLRAPVTMRAGLNLQIDLVMRVGAIDETVDVRLDTPLVETRHGGQAVNIGGELLRAIPLLERREWFGALTLAPGVTSAEWVGNERLFYVHGADSNANVVQIDGADVTPTAGSAIRYVGLSTDAIDDIQIKTAGVDASSPLGIGGIINIATASGTNALRALTNVFVQPRAWNASNNPGGTSATTEQALVDVSIGAPIFPDRLWIFGAYRYVDVTTGASRTPAQLDALRALVPGFVPFDATNTTHVWFAKLTAQPSSRHQVTGFFQYDVNPSVLVDPIGVNPSEEAVGGSALSMRLSSIWSNRFTTRIGASYNDKRRDVHDPALAQPLGRIFQSTIVSAGRPTGNGLLVNTGSPITAWTTRPNSKLTLSLDATGILGAHQVQGGIYAQPRIRIVQENHYINDGFVLEDVVLRQSGNAAAGVIPFHRTIMDATELTASSLDGQDYALYVQDAWRPTSRLTVNAGVRIDWVSWTDRLFDVTSQESIAVGPRFGVNYALTADSRRVLRGHWVRVHDQPSQMAPTVGAATLGQRDLYDADFNGTFETVFVTPSSLALTRGRVIDPDLHQPFVQDWGLGFTSQLPGRMSVGVDLLRREFRDRPTLVETNGRYDGHVFRGYVDAEFNEIYQVTNNQWNWPVYTSVELSLTKRTARVEGIASYVRQWRHMGGTWQPHDPASFIQPSAFENNRGVGNATGPLSAPTEANSLSGTHMTQRSSASAQWQDHIVRSGVTCNGPWSMLLATTYTFQSGAWSGPIVARVAAADPSFGPVSATLSNGRTVTNPLATVVRFAYPTRSEGQLKTPALHVWNFRVGRRFTWRRLTWDAALDVFNAANHGADLSFQSGANQTFNPLYGLTAFRQLPRSGQVTLRVSY